MTVNYQRKLQRYFDAHYSNYEESVEWFVDSAPNKWKFIVPELGECITLICDSGGKVVEQHEPRQKARFSIAGTWLEEKPRQ